MPQSGVAVPRGDDLYDEGREWHGLEWESLTARDRRRPRHGAAVAAPVRAARSSRSAAAVTEPPVRRTPAPRAERAQPAFDDAPRPRAQVAPARRTVTIRGQGAERYVPARDQRRRRSERRYESPGFRPDRAAMWAVLLCILMIVIAAASAHAATLHALTGLH